MGAGGYRVQATDFPATASRGSRAAHRNWPDIHLFSAGNCPNKPSRLYIGTRFSPEQVLKVWSDSLGAGIGPEAVRVLCLNDDSYAGIECRVALGLGAKVGIVDHQPGASGGLLDDALWHGVPNLLPLPTDPMTICMFCLPPSAGETLSEDAAKKFHQRYVKDNTVDIPAKLRPWEQLEETYKIANLGQAGAIFGILHLAGFEAIPAAEGMVSEGFTDQDVERMAEIEHGRWNVERLENGWRFGVRNNEMKIHNMIVPWEKVPNEIREYDRKAVRNYPDILTGCGYAIRRRRP